MLAVLTLWQREFVRFLRQRSRVVGVLGTPLIFWLLVGSGIGASFRPRNVQEDTRGYLEYFFPGMLILIILFTSIFSAIAIINDRKDGFLQGVMVAPVPRSAIALGSILGGTSLALLQAMLVVMLAPLIQVPLSIGSVAALTGSLALVSFALTSLSFVIAWHMESSQGFHAVMNLFLMPLWLLCGAVFPVSGSATWLSWLVKINPLSYGLDAVRRSLYLAGGDPGPIHSWTVSLGVTVAFAATMFAVAVLSARR